MVIITGMNLESRCPLRETEVNGRLSFMALIPQLTITDTPSLSYRMFCRVTLFPFDPTSFSIFVFPAGSVGWPHAAACLPGDGALEVFSAGGTQIPQPFLNDLMYIQLWLES